MHFYLISVAMGLGVPFASFFVLVPIATIVMMIPASINGIGVRDGVFALLLGLFRVSSSQAPAFSWLSYGIVVLTGLLGGVVYMLRKEGRVRAPKPAPTG